MEDSGSALSEGTIFETGDGGSHGDAMRLERGVILSRYLLVERVGVGGMGVVWAAYDPELDRKIAIKLLRPRRDRGLSELARTRLIREAQVMARINHPNVIAVHDVGEHDGQVFLAMEFVQGKTLGRWVRSTRRSWKEIVAVFVQAGRGLAQAHRSGLVHRDFKPANVLVDANGRARVLDFGLARSVEGPRTDREDEAEEPGSWSASRVQKLQQDPIVTPLTRTGSMLGTPAYMAPEQFENRSFDSRADQFAFCVALWEALHHRRPFSGSTIDELSKNVCSGTIVAPASDSRIPGFVDRALRRGLAVDPVERWPSMDALLAELSRDPARGRRRWMTVAAVVVSFSAALVVSPMLERDAVEPNEDAVVVACPDAGTQLQELWTPTQRHELSLAVLGSGALTPERWADVAAGLDAYARAYAAARVAVCEGTQAGAIEDAESRERCLDDRARAFASVLELLGDGDRELSAGAHGLLAALPPIAACERSGQLAAFVGTPGIHSLRSRILAARVRAEVGAIDAAATELGELMREAEALGDPALRIETLIERGVVEQLAGEPGRGRELLEQAVAEAIRGGHDVLAARAATRLIEVVGRDLGELETGLRWAARAEAWNDRVDAPAIIRAERLLAEAELRRILGELDSAARQFRSTLELLGVGEDELGRAKIDVAVGRMSARASLGLARIALGQADLVRARELLTIAVELGRRAYGAEQRDGARARIELARVEVELGDWDAAAKAFAKGLPDASARLEFASFVLRKAQLEPKLLDHAEGLVIAATDAVRLADGPQVDRATLELARLARLRGQLGSAQRLLDSLAEVEPLRMDVALERGELLLARKQPKSALLEFEPAITAMADHRGPSLAEASSGRGRALILLGRVDEGTSALEQALAIWDELAPRGHPRSIATLEQLASSSEDPARTAELRSRVQAIRQTQLP